MKQRSEFDCRAALARLAARHPSLTAHPDVAALLTQGSGAEESSVFEVVQELVLRPDVSLATLGCFRPVLPRILDTLVHSLKQLWRQGRASAGKKSEGFVGISTRLRNGGGWDLGLHEFSVILFSLLLDLAPYLLSSFLQYFDFAPPPFERLLHGGSSNSEPSSKDAAPSTSEAPAFGKVIRASLRLLQLEPKIFRELWDWSPFLDLLRSTPKIVDEESLDVRWCGVQIVSLVLQMSNTATLALSSSVAGLTEEDCFGCHLRWQGYFQEAAVEKAGMYLEKPEGAESMDVEDISDPKEDWSLSRVKSWGGMKSFHLKICGIELPIRQNLQNDRVLRPPSQSLVLTSTVRKNLEAVVLALSQRHPVLLEGPIGSGKSSLIQELAYTTGNWDLLFIHLDDQMDSKTLLGNYTCTEVPGEFKWQPGALTQAVVRGMWVVFEDIDRAPFEIFSALIPLLEDRKLYIPGRGEMIPAADNFRVFSTVTRTRHGAAASGGRREMLGNLWRKVVVDAPSDDELADIMRVRFPALAPLVPKMIGTLNLIKHVASQSTAAPANGFPEVSVYIGRQFSTWDLFKWCMRVAVLGPQALGGPVLSAFVRERIYVEGADCFGASIANAADRQLVMSIIGEYWNVPVDRVSFYATLNKPSSQMTPTALQVGRATLLVQPRRGKPPPTRVFANTGHAVRTLEAIAMCIQQQEPVLLVGETGTGKTSLVQHLAWQLGMPLTVLNMSQQTDSADFLGGYKPVEAQGVCIPLFESFNLLFRDTFPKKKNAELLEHVQRFAEKRKWDRLLKAFRTVIGTVSKLLGSSFEPHKSETRPESLSAADGAVKQSAAANEHSEEEQGGSKRKRSLNARLLTRWRAFTTEVQRAERQVEAAKTGFAFSFVEGVLVKAIREGHWLLLDEVNLAPVETLERLTGVLEGAGGTLSLTERGDVENVARHPNFRIFGCMNPAMDFGKRNLPISLRNRFTELYVDELTQKEDLHALVYQYLENSIPSPPVEDIVNFYLQARHEAETQLLDGANQKPQYSLRSLARALEYTCAAMSTYGFHRSLYDGICMSFLTLLDRPSALVMEQLINAALFKSTGAAAAKALKALLKVPPQPSPAHVQFEHFWVESGSAEPSRLSLEFRDRYVLTDTIKEHLKNLARAVFVRKYPVLLQGPTSSGKTSLVEYLATITSHRFVRINNHEHTDLQEYFGSYVTDPSGKLVFQEGILVEAVRKGYWIVLDELNLAPSDVLEALNRLLDDNRELFVPELQVTVKPHPHFMLFATQNPPGIYGGRKVLSRAFRNRFMELHVDDIPDDELRLILEKRCQIPGSYAAKMIEVMKDLQRHRQGSKVFAGKHGFITARDLFRWAERHGNGYEELARDGYMLLAERLRNPEEKEVVQKVLEKHMRVKLDVEQLHEMAGSATLQAAQSFVESPEHVAAFGRIVWTKSMKRLFNLVEHCIRHCEPVLLVGETGCGKTMICQLLSLLLKQRLHILNCHQHSETSDFLGGLRPVRERDSLASKFQKAAERVASVGLFREVCPDELPSKIEDSGATLALVKRALSDLKKRKQDKKGKVATAVKTVEEALKELLDCQREWQSLFVWHDGPLVQAMRNGDMFLVDEISLADDSVLERLNSVLEPKRLLVLAEKGGAAVEELIASPSFRLLATMNPGGDFGKKELSPALRNRFTEIWVPPISDIDDLRSIVVDRFAKPELIRLANPMLEFWQWFQRHHEGGRSLSVRDLLAWITYINVAELEIGEVPAFIHGAFLVLLDGIGFGMGLSNAAAQQLQTECAKYLFERLPENEKLVGVDAIQFKDQKFGSLEVTAMDVDGDSHNNMFGLHPFFVTRGDEASPRISFALDAPTTKRNAWRILRAMQLPKPVLLEGSPGVGKTSLVAALAAASGHSLVRINLSEQTDIMDLLGSDLPVEGGTGAEFQWSDGVFLQALKAGHWVLLDELNLASQSVLEGLNACLDHRGELFIPELGRSFKCPPTFRVFACQNPLSQGGGRKGLPKSFLNRFTKVYMDALSADDYLEIASILHPSLPKPLLQNMIEFNTRLHHDTMVAHSYGSSGAPWEFNLRDILRWCELMEGSRGGLPYIEVDIYAPEHFLDVIYLQRMRTVDDRRRVLDLFQEVFGTQPEVDTFPAVSVLPERLQVGLARLARRDGPWLQGDVGKQLQLLPGLVNRLEAAMHCVEKGWMCILVGPPATGKTSLIRLLAALTGNPLREFTLSSATDTTELLGCFEQHDLFRRWQEIVKRTQDSLKTVCSFCLSADKGVLRAELKLNMVKNLLGCWTVFQKCSSNPVVSLEQQVDQGVVDPVAVTMLLQTVEQLRQVVASCGMSIEDADLDPQVLVQRVTELKSSLGQLGTAGHFEWVDGGLLKAVERGEWVVLENANFCNPTVLDRLNPLLEPGGSIMINERGLVNGQAMVVRAHQNFRLFLTVDPAHGDVSRAMRNRGVELFMLQPDWPRAVTKEAPVLEELLGGPFTADLDSLKILIQSGIPSPALVQGMCKAHVDLQILTEVTHSGLPVSLRELSEWVALLQQLLERGGSLLWCLRCSWEQTYARRLDSAKARDAAMEKFHARLGSIDLLGADNWKQAALHTPGGWPTPLTLADYCLASKEAMVIRDSSFLEFLGVQSFAAKTAREWRSVSILGNSPAQRSEWLQGRSAIFSHFPASLLCDLLNPGKEPLEAHRPLPQVNTRDVDFVLLFACQWMIEQASCGDLNLRVQWLKSFTAGLQASADVLKRVVAALGRETAHALSRELVSAWERFARETGNRGARMVPPCAVAGYVSSSATALSASEEPNSKATWRAVVLAARKLQVLRTSLLQWEEEDELYRVSEKLGPNSTRGAVLQSYWQHKHRAERSRVSSTQLPRAMLLYLYALFSSLRKVENEVLVSSADWPWGATSDAAFLTLQEWHEALWKNLSVPKFDVEGFLFHWSLLKRSLQSLFGSLGKVGAFLPKAEEELKGLIKLIDEPFALGKNPLAKPLLWKFAGHPELPHSREVHDLELQVMEICQELWKPRRGGEGGDAPVVSADGNLRRIAMTGLSIIRWLGHDATPGRSDDSSPPDDGGLLPSSTVHLESLEIYQMLKERVEREKMDVAPLRDHDIIPLVKRAAPATTLRGGEKSKPPPHAASLPSFSQELLRWPSAWALWATLLPWLSHISIRQDTKLLAQVSLLAGSNSIKEDELMSNVRTSVSDEELKKMIDFAVACSARSPADLVPHQHLVWLLDGTHPTKTGVLTAFRDTVHELWVRWHSALWTDISAATGSQDAPEDWSKSMGPARLFHAAQTVHIASLLGRTGAVRDHHAKLTQLRVAASHLWAQAKRDGGDVFESNACSASALLQQIVYAHRKSFSEGDFRSLVSAFSSLHSGLLENSSKNDNEAVESLRGLLLRSQHAELVMLVEPLALPCARLLYLTPWKALGCGESLINQGRVWLLLGELRLRLLLPADGCDPVAKYSHKHTHIAAKSSELELKIKVRQESEYLVRGSRHTPEIRALLSKLEGMKRDLAALSLKLILRPDPPQFRDFVGQVLRFMKSSVDKGRLAVLAAELTQDMTRKGSRTPQEVSMWQDNATQFIDHLAMEFPAYRDVVQPVQLAVYELKFGLSLLQAGCMQTETFGENGVRLGEGAFMELLCTLMQFPSVRCDGSEGTVARGSSASCAQLVTNTAEEIISQVASSLTSSSGGPVHSEVLDVELKVTVMRVALLRIGIDAQQARVKGKGVLKLVEDIFGALAALWSEIRDRQLAREKEEDGFVRFTARVSTMETEEEFEEASFREMFVDFKPEFPGYDDDTAMASAEADDRRAEAALKAKEKVIDEGKQRLDKAWLAIQEPLIQDVATVHRHIFGRTHIPVKLCDGSGGDDSTLVSDEERGSAFSLAYQAGVRLIGAVGHSVPAKLDDLVVTSHVMQLGLEHKKVGELRHSLGRHNIYKDPNPPEMALMLEPLGQFLERVGGLLAEWPEHPILLQFLNIAKALVGISLDAPIMKALTGVELLLSKAQLWEENSAKHVSLAGEMSEMMKLVRRWRKLELESWPALLESTLKKHERSAEKLWFFLHGLLHREVGADDAGAATEATLSSLEEFMQMSPLGEFQKRLDLLLSFQGQFAMEAAYDAPHAGASSAAVRTLANVLYNVREYYSQFLPAVEEVVALGKAPIEKELKGFVKLTKWEDRGYYALALSAEKTHRKLHKLIRKYDDLLKKPVMELLTKQSLRMGAQTLSSLAPLLPPSDAHNDDPEKKSKDREGKAAERAAEPTVSVATSATTAEWHRFCESKIAQVTALAAAAATLQDTPSSHARLPSLTSKIGTFLGEEVFTPESRNVQEEGVNALDELSTAVISRSAELRKEGMRVKKKALSDLLKTLKSIGLSPFKSAVPKDERNVTNWFQQPPSDVAEVLTLRARQVEVGGVENPLSAISVDSACSVWTRARTYYYQNVALIQRLEQKALDHNKSLTKQEVERSKKYVEHLLFLQRKQRRTAYGFASELSALANLTSLLSGFTAGDPIFPQQGALRRWMWQQKGLLDSLCHTTAELCLLYKTAEASQRSPSESAHTEAGLLNTTLSKMSISLEACKSALDRLLVPPSESVGSRPVEDTWPLLITPAMHKVLVANFAAVKSMESAVRAVCDRFDGEKVPGLRALQLLLSRGCEMLENFERECASPSGAADASDENGAAGITPFMEHYDKIISEVLVAVQNLRLTRTSAAADELGEQEEGELKIQDMDGSISTKILALRLGRIHDAIMRAIAAGAEMVDKEAASGGGSGAALAKLLGCIYVPLQLLQAAGAQLLSDYVALQKTVSKLGYVLSNLFCTLYTDGFCLTKEEEEGEAGGTKFEDADGTGMGEGEGKKDVSDQIEEEDQLLGGTEKNEDAPAADDAGKKKEKGIEMEQDFDADMLDLSDDDEEDDEDEQEEKDNEKLESQMGEEGEKSEVVDEQLWNGDDDDDDKKEKQKDGKEKVEKDASVSGAESKDLEMRAKEEESEEGGKGEDSKEKEKDGKDSKPEPPAGEQQEPQMEQAENGADDEAGMNQDEAYEDPTGVKPRVEEELELPDDLNLDGGVDEEEEEGGQEGEPEGEAEEDDGGPDAGGEKSGANEPDPMDVDETSKRPDDEENGDKQEPRQEGEAAEDVPGAAELENGDEEEGQEGADEKAPEDGKKVDGNEQQGEGPSLDEPMAEQQQPELPPPAEMPQNIMSSDSRATGGAEAVPAGISGARGDPVSAGDDDDHKMGEADAQPDQSASELQRSALEDQQGNKRSADKKSVLSDDAAKKADRLEANPHRSLGDALKKWKEMVQLLDQSAVPDMDMAAAKDEQEEGGPEESAGAAYEYVAKEEEKASAQALGAATEEQLTKTQSLEGLDPEEEEKDADAVAPGLEELRLEEEEVAKDDMEGVEATQHALNMKKGRSANAKDPKPQTEEAHPVVAVPDQELEYEVIQRSKENESLVSLNTPDASKIGDRGASASGEAEVPPLSEEELRVIRKDLEVKIHDGDGSAEHTRAVWQKLEQLTVRLSQELSEQLRLILEPTLAAKLQGDYRSGKRINMKKIIPYVASQFRKDKIWLRRTKASKRQYQVVLAIDDSRSMSESHCGHMALEALITICKAMSQLEIGQMAVASFGEKGNVRLLHDFDQPFSTDAGLNMVSRFTFKQDNTIADEPMVDLLHYLTRMLDFAARQAPAPAGRSDLQQLVLVIADGRFHEKESLRRCIREAMNRKQLLAFLVLDNPNESLLDMQSVSFSHGAPSFSKYLDSFPFPYYILLRDIESLPRTLADLLRQWFELMQRSG